MTVTERIAAAKNWVDSLYQTDYTYGYVKEYPGVPVGIYIRDTGEYRLSGDWRKKDWWWWWMDVSKLTRINVAPRYDITRVGMEDSWDSDYNEPVLTIVRNYSEDGVTDYTVHFKEYEGNKSVDVYLGDSRLWVNVTQHPRPPQQMYAIHAVKSKWGAGMPYTTLNVVSKKVGGFRGIPCNRYTVRHAARLGEFIYWIWGDVTKAMMLRALRSDYGFTYDIYDPLFGVGSELNEDFMFTYQAYPDTQEVWAKLPRGMNPHRYPYFSKVQLNRSLYITQSYSDALLRTLQAIHILNKYSDANRKYYCGLEKVTPVDIAWETWGKWNGVGISHPQEASMASGVRTAAFFVLTTLLGRRYGVGDMWGVADSVFYSLTGSSAPQAGIYPSLPPGWIRTMEGGDLLRPPYHGAFYNLWSKYGNNVAASDKPPSVLDALIDMYAMPSEDEGPLPANAESTITMLQALRVYAYYALGTVYPGDKLLP